MTTPQADVRAGVLPPYLPYKTFLGFLDELKDTAVPQRIDNSIMRRYSGSLKTMVRGALRFFGCIDEMGMVQQRLRDLVSARNTPTWKDALNDVLWDVYREVIGDLDTDTGTLQQLKDRFRAAGTEGSVLIKAVRFYLSALDDTGTMYSPHFKARGLSTGVRSTPRTKPKAGNTGAAKTPNDTARSNSNGGEADLTPPQGTQRFTLPVKTRPTPATLILPEDMKPNEWQMIDSYIRMYFGFADEHKRGSDA
jgi:hypothetical protein